MTEAGFAVAGLFFLAAALYTSVGHGGASGYLAVMAWVGFAPALLRTTALSLNIVAASIALCLFMQRNAQTIQWRALGRLLLPFAGLGMPLAYLGGTLALQGEVYRMALGATVLWASWTLMAPIQQRAAQAENADHARSPARAWMWPAGAVIGFVSGLTGIGGGIFLSPLLIITGALSPKHSAPVSAAFILLNSIAGLAGVWGAGAALWDAALPAWGLSVACGAAMGAYWGSRRLGSLAIRRVLALVLAIAGFKLLGVFNLF